MSGFGVDVTVDIVMNVFFADADITLWVPSFLNEDVSGICASQEIVLF